MYRFRIVMPAVLLTAAGVFGQVGSALSTAGRRTRTIASQPAAGPASRFIGAAGALVDALGNTVSNAAGLFDDDGPNGVAPIPGLIVSVAGASVTTVRNAPSSGAGSNSGASGPFGGLLSGLGSTPLGSVAGALGGVSGGVAK
ncbi:hypothetical protein [Burkholderia anthina]|uniref:hypothetical protein n=1 Tax=Burkholderia anthina TaxID=179879 RepID=UPI00158A62D9|nr:hypothetical protein [Burkholderia anthina]